MRAVYIEHLNENDTELALDSDKAHHLINVLRFKTDETILLLDGNGSSVKAKVNIISKRKVSLKLIEDIKVKKRNSFLKLGIAQTKKEALDLSLKQAVEIGVEDIYIIKTQYSQDYDLREERLNKILLAALEQSNALFLPKVECLHLEDFLKKSFDKLVYFSSVQGSNNEENKYYNIGETCILIGPEAGLSEEEEKLVKEMTNSEIINLPTNIMRAPTAVSFCLGYILGKSV